MLMRAFGCLYGLTAIISLVLAGEAWGPNLYWPGDFERGFAGGCFSKIQNGTISETENHSPGGGTSWQLSPGYQHLELLVPGNTQGHLSFFAKSPHPQTVVLRVVTAAESADGEGGAFRTIDYPVEIQASGDEWRPYELLFETLAPYPRPPNTEILITAWNGAPNPVFVDNLRVRMRPSPSPPPTPGRPPQPYPLAQPEDGGERIWSFRPNADGGFPNPLQWEALNPEGLRGRRVRLSASVTYAAFSTPFEPWSGALLVLHRGPGPDAEVLQPLGGHPFWCPMGQGAPPGESKTISAVYDLPLDLPELTLVVQVQPGIGANAVQVENLTFEILDNNSENP